MCEIEICLECDGAAVQERVADVTHKIKGREIVLRNERHLYCPDCGSITYVDDMLEESQKAIAAELRRLDGLLTPDELRAIRLKYGLTQAEMERVLTTGPKTWVRWERGKVVHSAAVDRLLRQIAKNPMLMRDLMAETGIETSMVSRALEAIDQEIETSAAAAIKARHPELPDELVGDLVRAAVDEVKNVHSRASEIFDRRRAA